MDRIRSFALQPGVKVHQHALKKMKQEEGAARAAPSHRERSSEKRRSSLRRSAGSTTSLSCLSLSHSRACSSCNTASRRTCRERRGNNKGERTQVQVQELTFCSCRSALT